MDKSDFFENVYEVVKLIPRGRVTSYGAIACYLGSKQSARLVGWAMNASHKLNGVPAHRVVNRKGILTGKHHFETSNRMQELLEEEGVKIDEDRIVNYNELFWDPIKELEIL